MSLEWDGFHLSLGRDGLQFVWIGRSVFEAGTTDCVSVSLREPKAAGEAHRLVFRFRFPGIAVGTESVVIRVDVPPGAVERARRFVTMLRSDYSVPDEAAAHGEAKPAIEGEAGAGEGPVSGVDTRKATETETAPDEAELERVPGGPAWIVNRVGPRSEELFRDVMARPVNSDR
ncbi:hypothetical protein ABZ567_16325 [Streptomyces sp. NPDC016459]|uniref:hypothetical protein n=1 Tax=Streptomyces sp. NPDC016459 TaxID=3157190 RepID=UPI0033E537F3